MSCLTISILVVLTEFAAGFCCFGPPKEQVAAEEDVVRVERVPRPDHDPLVYVDRNSNHQQPCQQLRMDMYAANRPNPDKFDGNNAYITSHEKQMFVINHGVSGPASLEQQGYPHLVSQILAVNMVESFTRQGNWRTAIQEALNGLKSSKIRGSTTALVVRKPLLIHRNTVAIYNLGDSSVAHLRLNTGLGRYEFLGLTEIQRQSPGHVSNQFSGNERGCRVDKVDEYRFEVELGDLVIGATDGLWEVVGGEEVADYASRIAIPDLAHALTTSAYEIREKRDWPDDITVVVGHIVAPDAPQHSEDHSNCAPE